MTEWIRPDALGAFWAMMAGDEERARRHLAELTSVELMTYHQDLLALDAEVQEARRAKDLAEGLAASMLTEPRRDER